MTSTSTRPAGEFRTVFRAGNTETFPGQPAERRHATAPGPLRALLGVVLALLAVLIVAPVASAQSLDELRSSGAIGERYDGYVVPREPGAKQAAERINQQRRDIYQARAKEQGVDAEEVGKVYAQQIIRQAPQGTWFLDPNGEWRQK